MARYQIRNFKDIVDAVCESLKIQASDTESRRRVKRNINTVYLDEVVPFKRWTWNRGSRSLQTEAYVSTGTANVLQNSATVTLSETFATSKKGMFFTTNGSNDVYRIAQHSAGSATVTLETPYSGATNTAANFRIWTDAVVLPTDCKEVIEVRHDYRDKPVDNLGLQEWRRLTAVNPRAEGRPVAYTTTAFKDPAPFEAIASLPAAVSRSSSGLLKTLTFAADMDTFVAAGDQIEVSNVGEHSYNGQVTISAVSGTSIIYTGTVAFEESDTADISFTVKSRTEASYEAYRELLIYPSVSDKRTTLHVDYIRNVEPLENDTDEPMMPIEDRNVLYYGAMWLSAGRERNPEWAQENYQLMQAKLARMAGKTEDSPEKPQLKVSNLYLGSKRMGGGRSRDTGAASGGFGGGSPGGSVITGTPNTLASFNAQGNLVSNPDFAASDLVFEDSEHTLTNKTISSASNTLEIAATDIADGSVSNATFQYISGLTSDAQDQLDALDTRVDDTEAAIDALEAADISLDGRLDNAEADIIALTAEDVALDARLDTAEADITALEAADVALDGRLDTVEAALPTKQPLDSTLTALAAYNSNGLLTQTSADTFTARTLTGTANQIEVADGNGVSGNPTVSLPSTGLVLPGTAAVQVPAGTTAQRPAGVNSMIRYNSDDSQFEGYAAGAWGAIAGSGGGEINHLSPTRSTNGEDASTYEVAAETSNVTFTDSGDTVGAPGHNLNNGDTVSFTSITSTTGISVNTLYYVVGATSSTYQVASTSGGSALALTTNGIGVAVQAKPLATQPFLLGSPSLTFTSVTAAAMNGTKHFKIAKPASNTMGQCIRKQFNTGGPADYAKPHTVSFDVLTPSTFTDGDFTVWIHDNTNGVYIQPSAYRILKGSLVQKHVCEFQTSSNSSDYDLVIFCSTVSASAYDVLLDTLTVSPNTQTTGGSITDWTTFTPSTYNGIGTPSAVAFEYRRVGGGIEVRGSLTTGTTSASELRIGLPAGLTTKMISQNIVGNATRNVATTNNSYSVLAANNSTYFIFASYNQGGNTPVSGMNGSDLFGTGQSLYMQATVPIQGWGTSQVLSSETSSRIIIARVSGDPASAAVNTPIIFPTRDFDTHGAYSTSTGRYTCPLPGYLKVYGFANTSSAGQDLTIWVDGVSTLRCGAMDSNGECQFFGVVQVRAGQLVDIRPSTTVDVGLPSYMAFEYVTGPAQVAASETISASYTDTSTTISGITAIAFTTKQWDSHGAYSGSTFTAPTSGVYQVNARLSFLGTFALNSEVQVYASYGGTDYGIGYTRAGGANNFLSTSGATLVRLLAGQTLQIKGSSNVAVTVSGSNCNFSIARVGNY
jgi:hypothetical protein